MRVAAERAAREQHLARAPREAVAKHDVPTLIGPRRGVGGDEGREIGARVHLQGVGAEAGIALRVGAEERAPPRERGAGVGLAAGTIDCHHPWGMERSPSGQPSITGEAFFIAAARRAAGQAIEQGGERRPRLPIWSVSEERIERSPEIGGGRLLVCHRARTLGQRARASNKILKGKQRHSKGRAKTSEVPQRHARVAPCARERAASRY